MDELATLTMAETLDGMASMDEAAANAMLPKLAELLGRDTPEDSDQFGAAQEEIMEVFLRISGLRQNAQGIRLILKLGEDG